MLSVCKSYECTSKCCGEEDENGGDGVPGGQGPTGLRGYDGNSSRWEANAQNSTPLPGQFHITPHGTAIVINQIDSNTNDMLTWLQDTKVGDIITVREVDNPAIVGYFSLVSLFTSLGGLTNVRTATISYISGPITGKVPATVPLFHYIGFVPIGPPGPAGSSGTRGYNANHMQWESAPGSSVANYKKFKFIPSLNKISINRKDYEGNDMLKWLEYGKVGDIISVIDINTPTNIGYFTLETPFSISTKSGQVNIYEAVVTHITGPIDGNTDLPAGLIYGISNILGSAGAAGPQWSVQYNQGITGGFAGNNAFRFVPTGSDITLNNGYQLTTTGNGLFLGNGYLPAGITGNENNIFSFTSHNAQNNYTSDNNIQFDSGGVNFIMNGDPANNTPGGPEFRVESNDDFSTFTPTNKERITLQTLDGDILVKSRRTTNQAGIGNIKLTTNEGGIDLISSGGLSTSSSGGSINIATKTNSINLNMLASGPTPKQGIHLGVTGTSSYQDNAVINLETWHDPGASQSVRGGKIALKADCNDILIQTKSYASYIGQQGDIILQSDKGEIQLSSSKTIVNGITGQLYGELTVINNNTSVGIELIGATASTTSNSTINIGTGNSNYGELNFKNNVNAPKSVMTLKSYEVTGATGAGRITLGVGTTNPVTTIILDGATGYIKAEAIETTEFTATNITALNTLKGRDIIAEGSSGTLTVKNSGGTSIFEVDGSSTGYATTIGTSGVGPKIFMGVTGYASIRMGRGPTGSNAVIKIDAGATVGSGVVDISVPFKPWQATTGTLTSTTGLLPGTIGVSTTNKSLMYVSQDAGVGQAEEIAIAKNHTTQIASGSFDVLCGGAAAQPATKNFILIGEVKNNGGASFANICAMGPLTFPRIGLGNQPSYALSGAKQYLKISSQFFTTPSNQTGGLFLWARYILYRKADGVVPTTSTPLPEPKQPGNSSGSIVEEQQPGDPNGNCPKLALGDRWYTLQSDPISNPTSVHATNFAYVKNYKGVRLQRTDSGRAFTFIQYCTAPNDLTGITSTAPPSTGAWTGINLDNWYLILQVRDNYSTGTRSWVVPQGANIYFSSLGGISSTTEYGGPVNMSIEVISTDSNALQTNESIA